MFLQITQNSWCKKEINERINKHWFHFCQTLWIPRKSLIRDCRQKYSLSWSVSLSHGFWSVSLSRAVTTPLTLWWTNHASTIHLTEGCHTAVSALFGSDSSLDIYLSEHLKVLLMSLPDPKLSEFKRPDSGGVPGSPTHPTSPSRSKS